MADPRARLRLSRQLAWQADQCRVLGSPLYARLLSRAAKDAEAGGVVFEILRTQHRDPYASALGLRFMGAIHRIVLDGRADVLAAHYPSVGGDPAVKHLWRDFSTTLVHHQDEPHKTSRSRRRDTRSRETGGSSFDLISGSGGGRSCAPSVDVSSLTDAIVLSGYLRRSASPEWWTHACKLVGAGALSPPRPPLVRHLSAGPRRTRPARP
jgi:Uncharacterized protein conserved in bacteria (DUF2332)